MAKAPFWRSDAFLALLLAVLILLASRLGDGIERLERRFYDFSSTQIATQPAENISIIAIDDQSVQNIGRWPWPRDVHARLIDKLAQAQAKAIGYAVLFPEAQVDPGLAYVRRIREQIPAHLLETTDLAAVNTTIIEAEQKLNADGVLAQSIARAGNVVLPAVYDWGEPQGNADAPLPNYALRNTIEDKLAIAKPVLSGVQPVEILGNSAAAVAHLNQWQDNDGVVREEPLFINYYGRAVPSMAVTLAARALNLKPNEMKLSEDGSVQLGKLAVSANDIAFMLPRFAATKDGKPAFTVDSFYDVLNDKIPSSKYAGKIVIVGVTANGLGQLFATPAARDFYPATLSAYVTSAILKGQSISRPSWAPALTLLAFIGVALFLMLILPRLTAGKAAIASGVLLLALVALEFGVMLGANTWLELVLPMVLLVVGYLAITTKRFLFTEAGKVKADAESAETNRMMGLALQGQGRLDEAFDRYQRVPLTGDKGGAVLDNIYTLALDFERKRQFNKAEAAYQYIARAQPDYKDVAAKLKRAKNLSETVILGGGNAHPGGTLILAADGAVEKPMLGRYEVEKELGKGAMGVVYQGRDPKIGRVVAIKTLALKDEFDGEDLEEARARFFREAETAGRLQHQHIVTIFDAGEDQDLAYIAMEFLHGRDLTEHAKPEQLLPIPTVLRIAQRVALALDYAHKQGVVHRDIKPANIMYEPEADSVKVTDFGIARVTDSNKTKTGLVLGTPSFMSPEQIAGKTVDGRSDLYSLGVALYQLLTGHLPYQSQSLTELMYKITNTDAQRLKTYRPELGQGFETLMDRLLAKRPADRYQTGAELAAQLQTLVDNPAGDSGIPDISLV